MNAGVAVALAIVACAVVGGGVYYATRPALHPGVTMSPGHIPPPGQIPATVAQPTANNNTTDIAVKLAGVGINALVSALDEDDEDEE